LEGNLTQFPVKLTRHADFNRHGLTEASPRSKRTGKHFHFLSTKHLCALTTFIPLAHSEKTVNRQKQ
jgi:hypothetical protein